MDALLHSTLIAVVTRAGLPEPSFPVAFAPHKRPPRALIKDNINI